MSEHEFEAYLNLLARTLRLSDAQREQIAGELRDHLEARLDELTDQGVDRHDAILQALDEFGDAGVLADDLARPRHQQTRRRIMQTSFATIAAAAVVASVAMYLAPTNRQGQAPQSPALAATEQAPSDSTLDQPNGTLTIRAQSLVVRESGSAVPDAIDIDFDRTPLHKAIAFFRDAANLNIIVDWEDLGAFAAIPPDQAVTATLRQVDPYIALELVLDTLPPHQDTVRAVERDGVLFVSTASSIPPSEPAPVVLEQATFDCTRLLELRYDLGLPPGEIDSAEKLLRQFIMDTIGIADTRPVNPDANQPIRSVAVFGSIVTVNQPKPVILRLRDALDRTQAMLEELRVRHADREDRAKAKALAQQRDVLLAERNIHREHLLHARQKLDRIQALADSGTVAKPELEKAKHDLRLAELRLQQLEQQLVSLTP